MTASEKIKIQVKIANLKGLLANAIKSKNQTLIDSIKKEIQLLEMSLKNG